MNSLDYFDFSHGAPAIFSEGSTFLSPSVKAVVGTCTCANFLDHLDFRLVMIGSHSGNQDEFTLILFRDRSLSSYFLESCSNFELTQILLIIWIAVMLHWQYLLKGANFSPHL